MFEIKLRKLVKLKLFSRQCVTRIRVVNKSVDEVFAKNNSKCTECSAKQHESQPADPIRLNLNERSPATLTVSGNSMYPER